MQLKSLEDTQNLSKNISKIITAGDIIFLYGEIGVGKTTFVRFFINHLESKNGIKKSDVLSPTFNILYDYEIFNKKILHYDLFRLKNYKDIFSQKYSKNHKIILGMTSIEKNQIFNSLVLIDNNTNLLYKYKKNKLVPFGEFLPFENFLGKLGLKKITSGYQSFSAANTRNIMTINGLNFLPLICYEIIYSGRIGNKQEFDFILNISEDGWFGKTVGPHQHFAHSIFRSIEEGKNLIRSTNNGISAVIDPKGQVIDYIMSQGVIEVKTFKTVENTLFQNHGNTIFFYFLFIYITLTAFLKLRENK